VTTADPAPVRPRWPDPVAAAVTFVAGAVLIALGLTGLWSGAFVGAGSPADPWWFLVPLAIACVGVLLRRRAPHAALAVGTLALLLDLHLGSSLGTLVAFYDVLYSAALVGSRRLRSVLAVAAGTIVAVACVAALVSGAELRVALFVGLQLAALLVTPLWWASDVRKRNELLELADQRAADVERIHALSRERALGDARTAMARDLHDIVASHMSAIAIRSAASLAGAPDADRDRAALAAIRESALAGHADMRAMIALLRSGDASPDATVAVSASVDDLLETARGLGLDVRLEGGDPDAAATAPLAVQHALHRILQEALTNAVKHAPGARVAVALTTGADGALDLSVRSSRSRPPREAATSAGHDGIGLATMAERARAVGGTLTVDADDEHWTVAAHLPGADA
jgi:signal transduction histidine kinase